MTARDLVARFEQFFDESEVLVPAAAEAFACGDYAALGDIVDQASTDGTATSSPRH